ncbi:MAG: 4-hydroxy-3-methylbut-2-enyl diphosphate reductase [Bacteroidales bacterium]|nr:4-hydroxy-3-methylbut-2-enyl diphosphate reductase [Bacteroidales bacterium]
MKVVIDPNAGFCFGVQRTIDAADEILDNKKPLFCLGEIVHNGEEVKRLAGKGMHTIQHTTFKTLKNETVLIRAHGEPPETYKIAQENNINLIEASCPIVIKLQEKVKKAYAKMNEMGGQVVIAGKKNHPEIIGLNGQTNYKAIIINSFEDINKIDFTKPISLFAQTTISNVFFVEITEMIREKIILANGNPDLFYVSNSICKQVSNRVPYLKDFSKEHDVVVFVSGKNSSNGNSLFKECKKNNLRSYFISSVDELKNDWFELGDKIGISGATSTPGWLMKQVAQKIMNP